MKSVVVGMLVLGSSMMASRAIAGLNPVGTMCGDKRCSTIEYCSPYDKHCKPCSSICDVTGRNYQPLECISDCQEYLHDKRYVLLKQHDDLQGEIGKLWILVSISFAVALLSLLSTLYLLARKFARWEKMRGAVHRALPGKWIKKTANNRNGNGNNNNTNNNNNKNHQNHQHQRRKAEDDAELGMSKPTGLKLAMPTISASVAPARQPENVSGSRSASGSGSGSASGVDNVTPNTTSTSLSRRHPSEDTTLDYAYDNPAMTPSPETVQLRTKRESSF